MKKRYQIEQQRAVQQFRRLATEQNPNIQMILPLADIVGLLQQGVGNLLRQTGLELNYQVILKDRIHRGNAVSHHRTDCAGIRACSPIHHSAADPVCTPCRAAIGYAEGRDGRFLCA